MNVLAIVLDKQSIMTQGLLLEIPSQKGNKERWD